jgi:outer membrane protein assembly factor BamB
MNRVHRWLAVGLLAASPAMLWGAGAIPTAASNANWPHWRGPEGNGVSRATNLPTTWSLEKNIVWKTPLPAWSGGTPVVWGDRIFVTSPSESTPETAGGGGEQEQGTRRGGLRGTRRDPGGQSLLLICISRKNGSVLWKKELDRGNQVWMKQNNTSPSPVTDGKHVWVVTGNGVVTALTMDGKEVWKRNLQRDYGKFGLNWGYASSPTLYNGMLIIQVLHGYTTDDPSYVVAFNSLTGKEIWRRERPTDAPMESPDAYTTPAILKHGGTAQIVISGGDYVTGHDPATGKEIWRAGGLNPQRQGNYRIVASPVVSDGLIYAPSRRRPLLAIRAGGRGDITATHIAWKWDQRGGPDVPTPVTDGKYFYMVDDSGYATCLDAKTGQLIWGPERTAPGTVDSSPLLADGKLYILNENAVTTVLAAGPQFKVLATNELDGSYTLSSIAVAGKQLFVRTGTHLYCIEEKR